MTILPVQASVMLLCRDIVDNKIAAREVGDDLRKVTNSLTDTVSQTERTAEKKVSNNGMCCAQSACSIILAHSAVQACWLFC